ncbi:Uncharacterised protein [Klebsiella pneumoniae]|jgi:hypothetical protein|nr:Uncharacterised protein [Klebsiella pneumoniae]
MKCANRTVILLCPDDFASKKDWIKLQLFCMMHQKRARLHFCRPLRKRMRKTGVEVIPKCFTLLTFVNSLLTNLTRRLSGIFQWLDFN